MTEADPIDYPAVDEGDDYVAWTPPLCKDVFPGHRNPAPGPPSVPRKCARPAGHDGQHDRDGVRW